MRLHRNISASVRGRGTCVYGVAVRRVSILFWTRREGDRCAKISVGRLGQGLVGRLDVNTMMASVGRLPTSFGRLGDMFLIEGRDGQII